MRSECDDDGRSSFPSRSRRRVYGDRDQALVYTNVTDLRLSRDVFPAPGNACKSKVNNGGGQQLWACRQARERREGGNRREQGGNRREQAVVVVHIQ
jgi:hypothetical protein